MSRRPDFILLGQGKAGTSLVFRTFKENPRVGLCHPKELHYFNRHFDKGMAWYLSHFDAVPDGVDRVGEISPSYLNQEAVDRIHAQLGGDLKVIFILRHPVYQAYSRYLQNLCATGRGGSFSARLDKLPEFLAGIEDAIAACYTHFGADHVLPLIYERDVASLDPGFEARICDFLGLPNDNHAATVLGRGRVNAGVMPRYLFGGDAGLDFEAGGKRYVIPPGQLVFCAQSRNSKWHTRPTPDRVAHLLAEQASWTQSIEPDLFARLQSELVTPFADRLSARFGYDLGIWQQLTQKIAYEPASPPDRYLHKSFK